MSEIKVNSVVNSTGDNDSGLDLATNDQVKVKIANAEDFIFKANSLEVQTGSNIDMNGTELILDADGDTSITADTDDQIDFKVGGSDKAKLDANAQLQIGGQVGTLRLGNDSTYHADIEWEYASNELAYTINNVGNHTFNTNGSERMRIDSSGHLIMGRTGAFTSGGSDTGGSGALMIARDNERCLFLLRASSNGEVVSFARGGVVNPVGTISITTTSTAYNTSSDYRLKENVVTDWDATTRLKQLKPSRFNFIADADTTVDGFLAHEVSDVVPEAITGTKDEVDEDGNPKYQGIDQSKLVPLLVKTIQELEARITALEGE